MRIRGTPKFKTHPPLVPPHTSHPPPPPTPPAPPRLQTTQLYGFYFFRRQNGIPDSILDRLGFSQWWFLAFFLSFLFGFSLFFFFFFLFFLGLCETIFNMMKLDQFSPLILPPLPPKITKIKVKLLYRSEINQSSVISLLLIRLEKYLLSHKLLHLTFIYFFPFFSIITIIIVAIIN